MKLLCRNKETFFGVFFLLLSLYLLWETSRFSMPAERIRTLGPEVFPNVLASVMGVLSVMLVVQGLRNPPAGIIPARYWSKAAVAPTVITLGSLSFIFLAEILGFALWSALFLALLQYALGQRRFLINIAISIAFSLIMYGLFGLGLNVPLPRGILPF